MATGAKRLTAFSVNWGRGEGPVEFRANVERVLAVDDDAVLGVQELDEADRPPEHALLRQALDPDDHLVGWNTYEPLIIPGHLRVRRSEVIPACKGLAGLSPARFFVEAVVLDPDRPHVPPVVFMNHHAPRNTPALALRRAQCRQVHRRRMNYWYARGFSIVWTGDMNDATYPKMLKAEKTATRGAIDYIRYAVHPKGAQITVTKTGSVPMSIDKHNAIWARFNFKEPQ